MEPTHQLELSHQPASRGLADALKQYGVLRSHSITQQAGIQIEEKKLRILEKRRLEEEQKGRTHTHAPKRPLGARPAHAA